MRSPVTISSMSGLPANTGLQGSTVATARCAFGQRRRMVRVSAVMAMQSPMPPKRNTIARRIAAPCAGGLFRVASARNAKSTAALNAHRLMRAIMDMRLRRLTDRPPQRALGRGPSRRRRDGRRVTRDIPTQFLSTRQLSAYIYCRTLNGAMLWRRKELNHSERASGGQHE
jgi:hypothetical protein